MRKWKFLGRRGLAAVTALVLCAGLLQLPAFAAGDCPCGQPDCDCVGGCDCVEDCVCPACLPNVGTRIEDREEPEDQEPAPVQNESDPDPAEAVPEETAPPVPVGTTPAEAGNEEPVSQEPEGGEDEEISLLAAGIPDAAALQAAINEAALGAVIQLTAPIEIATAEQRIVVKDKEITLDLNGQTVDATMWYAIRVQAGGKLTITDSVGGGLIKGYYTDNGNQLIQVKQGGELVVDGGTIRISGSAGCTNSNAVQLYGGEAGEKPNTLTVTGGSIEADGGYLSAVYVDSRSGANLSGGTIKAENGASAIQVNAGTSAPRSTVEITGSTLTAAGADSHCVYVPMSNSVDVTVSGGKFQADTGSYALYHTSSGSRTYVLEGAFEGAIYNHFNATENLVISGGTFTDQDSAKKYLDEGLDLDANGKVIAAQVSVEDAKAFIQAGGNQDARYFATLKDALDAAADGDEVILKYSGATYAELMGGDMEYVVRTNDLTINLGGNTIREMPNYQFILAGNHITLTSGTLEARELIPAQDPLATTGRASYVVVSNGQNIKVKNLTTLGGISVSGGSATLTDVQAAGTNYYAVCAQVGADVTIESGNYGKVGLAEGQRYQANAVLWVEDGASMEIQGGVFDAPESGDIVLQNHGSPVIYGGTFNRDVTDYAAEDYEAKEDPAGTWTVVEKTKPVEGPAARNDWGTTYNTLQEAVDASGEYDNIYLLRDVTEDVTVGGGHKVAISLGNNSPSGNYMLYTAITVEGGSYLRLENYDYTNRGTAAGTWVANHGDRPIVTVEAGGEFELSQGGMQGGALVQNNGGKVTVGMEAWADGIFEGPVDSVYASAKFSETAKASIGEISGKDWLATAVPDGKTGDWYISGTAAVQVGGKMYGSGDLQLAIDQAGDGETVKLLANLTANVTVGADQNITLDLNGKTLTGVKPSVKNQDPALRNLGTLVITGGGTIKHNANDRFDGNTVENAGMLTVENGKFQAKNGRKSLVNTGALDIKGGAFAEDVSAENGTVTLPDGYELKQSGSTWSLVEKPLDETTATAKIVTDEAVIYYRTLQEAVTAAVDGQTVVLMKSVTVTAPITVDKAVTVTAEPDVVITAAETGHSFLLSNGAVLDGLTVRLDSKGNGANIVGMQADSTVRNCGFTGQYVNGDGEVSRAIEAYAGAGNLTITGNTFASLRQPGYLNGGCTGTVSGNTVLGTKGWVVCGDSNLEITGETFQDNAVDIAIIHSNDGTNSYAGKATALSVANNNAKIENQIEKVWAEGTELRVDAGHPLAEALKAAAAGDTVKLTENVGLTEKITIDKPITLDGGSNTITAGEGVTGEVILITAGNAAVQHVTVTGGEGLHGVQVWKAAGVSLTGVTLNGGGKDGLLVNQEASVTATDLTVDGGHAWGSVNVDKGSTFTLVSGELKDEEKIWVDDGVSTVHVPENWWSYTADGKTYYTPVELTLTPADAVLAMDGTAAVQLTVENLPKGAAVTWTSSGETVATVDANGVVTAVAGGETTITAAVGTKRLTCTVTVTAAPVAVTGVELNLSELSLTVGGTGTLTATVRPENATGGTALVWTSGDETVATVDGNGVVTAVSAGTTTITAAVGGHRAECAVTVTAAPVTMYTVTFSYQGNTVSNRYAAGTVLTGTQIPTVPGYTSGRYRYTFQRWNPEVVPVTADATYTAVYTSTYLGGGSSSGGSSGGGSSRPGGGTNRPSTTIDDNDVPLSEQPFLFTDVAKGSYCYDAVAWAVEKGVTGGVTATTFAPDRACTRAQIVTFLWRAAGSPAVSGDNPFTDVAAGSYYYDAVLWAVANGITGGTTATTFSPDTACTRGQAVTFLYRAAGSPETSGTMTFSDVPAGAYYTNAVLWAVAKGVTSGTTATTFAPDNTCTRGQIVTFLYRDRK